MTAPATCVVNGCGSPAKRWTTAGLCAAHASRLRRHGDVQADRPVLRAGRSLRERFEVQVDRSGPEGSCWLWTGGKNTNGYGVILKGSGPDRAQAHRVAYELLVGPIPEGLELDHRCHTDALAAGECAGGDSCPHRACVNPAHLEAVTGEENKRRMAVRSFCVNGHEYTPQNTYVVPKTAARACLQCRCDAGKRRTLRRRSHAIEHEVTR